jgi:hypothetical protein
MGDGNIEYGKLIANLFIMILIITSVIIVLPSLSYIYNLMTGNNMDIKQYNIEREDTDKFNTLNEIYLFCSYIPSKRTKVCDNKNDGENTNYKNHQKEISNIIDILSKIKKNCKQIGEKLKETSNNDIKKEVDKRLAREQQDKMMKEKNAIENMKENGENSRFSSKMYLEWGKVIIGIIGATFNKFTGFISELVSNGLKFSEVMIKILDVIKPLFSALLGNKVVMGFIILVFVIFIILGYLKTKDDADKRKSSSMPNLGGTGAVGGFSLSSIYEEIMDTLKYYSDMMKNFKFSDITGGLLQTDDNKEKDDDDNGLIISRKKIDGKKYDNLSYIMLSDVFNDNDISESEYFGKGVKIENGKYYNIYLPEEKFKDIMPSIKWKVSGASRNSEKIWKIDCENMETIQKNGLDTKKPAFISSKGVCIINEGALDEANKSLQQEIETDIPYKTEYIK